MKYVADHDIHIHSHLSSCSHDPEQTTEVILNYATECGYKYICLTDHFWDETIPGASNWYKPQNFAHISESLPLPQNDKVKFFFGCEAEMDQYLTIGVSKEVMDKLDFFIVPITHLHMSGFTRPAEDNTNELRVEHFIKRFNALLDYDLPAHKVGIAHLTCPLMTPEKTIDNLVECLKLISDDTFRDLFTRAAKRGYGIELNFSSRHPEDIMEQILRPYRIAKECGCKFYLGSDMHTHGGATPKCKENFERIIDMLGLTEDMKFNPFNV